MFIRLFGHIVIALGGTVLLYLFLRLEGDQLLYSWLIFIAVIATDDYLIVVPATKPQKDADILDYFDKVDYEDYT